MVACPAYRFVDCERLIATMNWRQRCNISKDEMILSFGLRTGINGSSSGDEGLSFLELWLDSAIQPRPFYAPRPAETKVSNGAGLSQFEEFNFNSFGHRQHGMYEYTSELLDTSKLVLNGNLQLDHNRP